MPTLGGLGFNSPTAKADLEELGWLNSQSVELLWALSGAGDPDLALNTLIRLRDQLTSGDYADGKEYADFDAAIRSDVAFRVRLLSLVGASTAMGDHLAANPGLWRLLAQPLVCAGHAAGCVGKRDPHHSRDLPCRADWC